MRFTPALGLALLGETTCRDDSRSLFCCPWSWCSPPSASRARRRRPRPRRVRARRRRDRTRRRHARLSATRSVSRRSRPGTGRRAPTPSPRLTGERLTIRVTGQARARYALRLRGSGALHPALTTRRVTTDASGRAVVRTRVTRGAGDGGGVVVRVNGQGGMTLRSVWSRRVSGDRWVVRPTELGARLAAIRAKHPEPADLACSRRPTEAGPGGQHHGHDERAGSGIRRDPGPRPHQLDRRSADR